MGNAVLSFCGTGMNHYQQQGVGQGACVLGGRDASPLEKCYKLFSWPRLAESIM